MRSAQWRPVKLPTRSTSCSGRSLLLINFGRRRRWDRGCGGQGAPHLSPVMSRLGSFREQIDDSHRLVAHWTQSPPTYTVAKGSAANAESFPGAAVAAGCALVQRAVTE